MQNEVVSRQDWLEARKALLEEEKQMTKALDLLAEKRRALPWVKVEEDYVFEDEEGPVSFSDLFEGRSQLITSQFMLAPAWEAGCPGCSMWADGYSGQLEHLYARDISLVAISRAPLEKLLAYRKRMGWRFKWVSSGGNRFPHDYGTSFDPEEIASGEVTYNYRKEKPSGEDREGFSMFYKNEAGEIFHTYSCYARGLDIFNGIHQMMDLTALGRNEKERGGENWVKRRDEY